MLKRRLTKTRTASSAVDRSFSWSCGEICVAFLFILLLALPSIGFSNVEDAGRPKIGLVLSGGGARGVAHVGVIKVLDELRVPIDYIAGTSMGAIVGGLYASGMSATELEQIILTADWQKWLSDRPPRAQRSYRRKADDFGFLVNFDIGVRKGDLVLPQGIVQGQNFTLALRRWLQPVATVDDFDELPIPFRAVATDLINGKEAVLDSGDLPTAIRASMSAPGIFKPVRVNDQILVDGGVADNLPIAIAKAMGAEVLIVVDVGYPLADETELDSALKITSQMLTIMMQARTEAQKQLLTPRDVLINPQLGLMGSQAFHESGHAMRLGELAARHALSELQVLSASELAYSAYRESLLQARPGSPVIHRVVIENESKLSTKALQARLSEQRGAPVDVDQLEADIADIYGFDTFETVDYSIAADGTENELLIRSTIKSWGPNYLRFGINLEDDFDGNSSYNFATRFTKTEMNAKGGEFQADVVVGENPQLAAEFYQLLDYRGRWFVNPRLSFQRMNRSIFEAGNELAQFRSEETEFAVGVGRTLGSWGELRFTLARTFGTDRIRIGDPALGSASDASTNFRLGFGYDTIDRIAIPRFGTNLQLGWLGLREGFGADQTLDIAQLVFLKPQTWGNHTLLHWWDAGYVEQSNDSPLNAFQLGGLFSLSGYARNELDGDYRGMGRLLYYRRLGNAPLPILDTPVYVGGSIEIGNVWQTRSEVSFNNTLTAGSIFVVFDTVIGPLYLAYGAAEGDRKSAYLFLGQSF